MKRFSILFSAMILIAAGIFTSCEEEANMAPVITFTNGISSVDLGAGDTDHTITGTIEAEAGLDQVKIFQVTDAGETQLGSAITDFKAGSAVVKGTDGLTYNFSFDILGITDDIVVKVQATDKDNQTASKNFTITAGGAASTLLTAAQSTTWKREGGNDATGLGMFGLKWTKNLKAVSAVVEKDGASKFVELSSAAWGFETYDELVEAVDAASDMASYKEISAEANATYNDILATVYEGNYYLIKVVSANVSSGTAGTVVTVDVEYKTVAE